jgi:hypothetical protein
MNIAVKELENKLIKAKDTSYDGIDTLMRIIMRKYNLTAKELHNSFVDKHNQTPDTWIKEMKVKKVVKTFEEFMIITERYYPPDEKLPGSDKSPVQKAEERQQRPFKTKHPKGRKIRHAIELERSVRRGADNPNIDIHRHPELDIKANNRRGDDYEFYHHPSGIKYHLRRLSSPDEDGRDTYSTSWNHSHTGRSMSDKTARHTVRNALKVWDDHIVHRLPYNSVVHNQPTPNYKFNKKTNDYVKSNTRAKLYQRKGFGPVKGEDQYAKVGRNPSPKQRAKGKVRLKPL